MQTLRVPLRGYWEFKIMNFPYLTANIKVLGLILFFSPQLRSALEPESLLKLILYFDMFNRPGAAGAVLQTPLSLINWLIESSFVEISSEHLHSKTVRAGKLKFGEKVLLPHLSCVTCHMSRVMCHMSGVTCHMSGVTCHMSCVTCHM